jgi:acyl-CoA thioester hydrolase
MFVFKLKYRVLYADVDKMNFVYYGNYARYFEYTRTEALRSLGISYRELEDSGIVMPVISMSIRYYKPAVYDDLLLIEVIVSELPQSRIQFNYTITNENGMLLNEAETTLVFLNEKSKRPVKAPELLVNKLKPYFEEKLV